MRTLFRRRCSALLGSLALAACVVNAPAADGAPTLFGGIVAGNGDNVDIYGVHGTWAPRLESGILSSLGLEPRLAAQLVRWHGRDHATAHPSLIDTSLVALLRWPLPTTAGIRPFIEAGAGVHLLSNVRINDDRQFSTAFQFGSQGGAGVAFGAQQQWELAGFFHHVSNSSLVQPNDGLTYFGVVLRYGSP